MIFSFWKFSVDCSFLFPLSDGGESFRFGLSCIPAFMLSYIPNTAKTREGKEAVSLFILSAFYYCYF